MALIVNFVCKRRSSEISEKCIRHHINACVLALRDAVWRIISGEQLSCHCQCLKLLAACIDLKLNLRWGKAFLSSDAACFFADAPTDAKPVALQRRAGTALASGAGSLLRALKEYGEHPSAAAAWQEALVELLQGSLQRLLVSLVQLFLTTCGIDLQVRQAGCILIGC